MATITLNNGIRSKLCPRLLCHIEKVDLDRLSRVATSRLTRTALPNIAKIELVSAETFEELYNDLYISMFPSLLERERSDLIIDRLAKDFAGERKDLAPYRIVGIRGHDGKAAGAGQFSVLLLSGGKYAVPYLQYIYVRQENRKQDMAEVLHTIILAVAEADAQALGERHVPFTLFETEPAGHGRDETSRATATQRALIHTRAGAVAIMLHRKSDGCLLSPHVQPGLEPADPPLTLVWAIRKSPALIDAAQEAANVQINAVGQALITAYYQSLRDEGFPETNIRIAETMVSDRNEGCDFILMPLNDVGLPVDHHTNVENGRYTP